MTSSTNTAIAHLYASRQKLRAAMQRQPHPSQDKATAAGTAARAATNLDWRQAVPGNHRLASILNQWWWARHPLRIAAQLAAATAVVVLRPVARRHPRTLLVGVAVMGGLLMWSRPWRWLLKPALFTEWLPQLAAKALANKP